MELKLEQLEYQQQAIKSVISVFKGQEKNTFDNACVEGIRSNILSLSSDEVIQNMKDIDKKQFTCEADNDAEVVCFLKLPSFYKIKTPAGDYNHDFGLVLKKQRIREENGIEYYFVIETKGTNNLDDRVSLTENEIYKIKCAMKHFEALGIEAKVNYLAPIKEYSTFKNKAEGLANV